MIELIGRSGSKALFTNEDQGVVVDAQTNSILEYGDASTLLASASWEESDKKGFFLSEELATAALTDLDISVLSSNDRMYTIPDGVKAEAKRGLKWRKKEGRGGTKVGMNTARTLAKGGQIGIRKVQHIAKYFPRHEVDKKGKGYEPGEDGYPSNGRIAWALWGGDAGQRWASRIVERENKKKKETSISAGGYDPEVRIDLASFTEDTEFYIRIRLDGTGIDRLYRVLPNGMCQVWDDGCWDDMGDVAHDFITFDKALDDPYDGCKKIHVPVDLKTAIAVSALFDNDPFTVVKLTQIEPEETTLFEKSIAELDWTIFDQLSEEEVEEDDFWDDGLMASAAEFADAETQDSTPGVYTSEERSEAASQQVRDRLGRFAEVGQRVVIGGNYNYQGNITAVNGETQQVAVELDNGSTVNVDGSAVQEVSTFEPIPVSSPTATPLDFSGILGEPRVPIDQPKAQLPGRLPPLTAADTNLLVSDWDSWVADQRLAPEYEGDALPPFVPKEVPDINTAMGRYYKGAFNPDGSPKPGWNPAVAQNVYNEPLLRDWLDERYANKSGEVGYHNRGWYTPRNYPTPAPVESKKSREQVYDPTNVSYWEDRFNPVNFAILAAGDEEALTPETSDVPVMYLAIVADDDPQAVMELVALVPATKTSNAPVAYKRQPGEWVKDNQIITDLKSATPPPVIVLDNAMLSEVTEQIDGVQASVRLPYFIAHTDNKIIRSLVAAGGLDRNRGNAEELRRYWTIGKGALKIRWNTPGDWTRCNRQLRKYMGPRAKGYCALRHKEMTGVWPGDRRNIGKKKGKALKASAELETLKSEEQIISEFTLRARAEGARAKMHGRHGSTPSLHGPSFSIPLVIPEGVETGDGRIFKKGSISLRDLPLPLLWQIKTADGHDGSVVVGQIVYMERTSAGIGNAYGVFDTGPYAKEAERLVRHGFIRGVSADMDKFQTEDEPVPNESEAGKKSEDEGPSKINIKSARVMAVTIVPKPAFQECYIQIIDDSTASYQEEDMTPDGIYVDEMDPLGASALIASGITAASVPVEPPSQWFENPKLGKPTPLTITDDGQVFGHIAAWHVDHIGMASGTRPPRSRSNYAYFHTGTLKTSEGSDVPVGQLTLAGGHAGMEASAAEAVRHYDDTASAFADVHAGEDAYGIWVAGSLRPGITPEQVRAARASAPSGDWRPINGRLELVAVCQVNVPGFPIARARVASGQVMALVAAGASVLAQMRQDPLAELNRKVDEVIERQNQPYAEKASALKSRFSELTTDIYAEKAADLATRVKKAKEEEDDLDYMIQMMDDNPESEMAVIPRRVRKRLAKEGKAMPDGSFPIRNPQDLKNAIRAYGRAKPGSKGAVRKHIMRRAKALNKEDLIPPRWSTAYSDSGEEFSIRDRALAAAAEMEFKQFTREEREALAKKGQALPDGSYPIRNEEDLKNAIQAYGRSNPEDRAKVRTHIRKRARALGKADLIPENWKAASTIDEIADDLKVRAGLAAEFAQIEAVFAELPELDPEEIKVIKQLPERDEDGRVKYTPETQPRDAKGRFRRVLARLKSDLGTSGLQDVVEKVEEAENLAFAGDYAQASASAAQLIETLERLDTKALNPEALENIKTSATELGEVIANLPLAFGEEAQKIRFSDVPPALQNLMKEMISRVEEKIGQEDADIATQGLRDFMTGSDLYNQGEISSEMSKLLRLLT